MVSVFAFTSSLCTYAWACVQYQRVSLLMTLNSLLHTRTRTHTYTFSHTHTPSPHAEVREPLVFPLLIISFNLRKQTQAVMSISYLEAAIRAHTPFCLLLQIQGEDRGDRLAEKTKKWERPRRRNKLKRTDTVKVLYLTDKHPLQTTQ